MLTETPKPQLGLDLVALGDRDVAHVVAEPGQPQRSQPRHSRGRAIQRPIAARSAGSDDVAGDGLAGDAEAGLDEAELPVAVRGLVEVHEVHVDRTHGSAALAWVCRCSSGLRSASRPVIHILAGENVCIQAITPTQSSVGVGVEHDAADRGGLGEHRLPHDLARPACRARRSSRTSAATASPPGPASPGRRGPGCRSGTTPVGVGRRGACCSVSLRVCCYRLHSSICGDPMLAAPGTLVDRGPARIPAGSGGVAHNVIAHNKAVKKAKLRLRHGRVNDEALASVDCGSDTMGR